ncbi:MAG: C2H2-type zinc finger protein [Nanoarchaeota archaeon]
MNEIKCDKCNRVFTTKEALEMHNKSKHPEIKPIITQKTKRKIVKYIIALIIIILISYGGYNLFQRSAELSSSSYTKTSVHWHAYPTVIICGEEKQLPHPLGSAHLGNNLLHTHAPPDNFIHIEGRVYSPDEIKLGKYLDVIGVKFDQDRILDKKNGDLCNNKAGKLRIFVNDIENFEFRDYIMKDQDKILIKYE